MNVELKAMLGVLFVLVKAVVDLVEKKGSVAVLADLEPLLAQIPSVVSNFSDLANEVKNLDQPANLADMLSFIASQFAGLDDNAKAQAILSASLKLASDLGVDGVALYKAIQG